MAERKTTETQDRILARIAEAIAAERNVESVARIEAEEMVRARVREARNTANALIHEADATHHITRSAIARRGLGNTNRVDVVNRINEHAYRTNGYAGPIMPQATAPVEAAQVDTAVRVQRNGDAYVVDLDQLTHEDVGENLSGEVVFDTAGNVLSATGNVQDAIAENPLLPMRLWGTEEVRNGVRSA